MPDVLTMWSLAVLVIGGVMYMAMSMSSRNRSHAERNLVLRRPGWIARRRARGGIAHPRGRVGVGYRSAMGQVHLSERELAHHGALFGGPGSGKTTFLQLLVEASAGRQPVVVVDPKGSPALAETVRTHGGQVWTLDGRLPADLLDPRPWQVPDLLLEAEDYSAEARAYRDAAHQRAQWAAWALALRGEPMDLAQLRRLLDREALMAALEPYRGRDPRIGDWLARLQHQRGGIEDSGARGLDRSLGTLLDGVALRGSLRTCPEALRLDDVMDTCGLVLFSLDAADYPQATRKVASWILLGMGRLARQLGDVTFSDRAGEGEKVTDVRFQERAAQQRKQTNLTDRERAGRDESVRGVTDRERAGQGRSVTPRALLLVDEVGALGHSARHLRGLVGRARESGLAVVLATQGPSDLDAVDRALLPQVLQDTAWQLAFRQGSPQDARHMEELFGKAWIEDQTRWSDGRSSSRQVQRPRVQIDEWMNALEPGDAWLRVAPIDRGWRQQRVRVALPRRLETSDSDSVTKPGTIRRQYPNVTTEPNTEASDVPGLSATTSADPGPRLPPVPPDCPPDLAERMGADVLAKVERRWPRRRHELGPCLVWTGATSQDGRYGRIYDASVKKTDYVHRVVWRRCYGPIPPGRDVDHVCNVTLCERPDHLELVTKPENTRRRHRRAGEATP